jgi:hypothetical protein
MLCEVITETNGERTAGRVPGLRAIDLANTQGSVSLVLRAAIERARLAREPAKACAALDFVRQSHSAVSHEFETADLKSARLLLAGSG